MAEEKEPVTIKKYANRRLYNTGTSTYVTLEDLATMVKVGDNFVVYDAKTGEDITRSVLAQIIFEQENKEGQSLLPIAFLRQLIRFYGDSMQMLVPSFLEQSMQSLTSQQGKFREQISQAFGVSAVRADRGPGAAEHGNVRKDLRHVRARSRAAKASPRRTNRKAQAARWMNSSANSTRCRSVSINWAARNRGFYAVAALFVASHGRSGVASPISAPCRKSQPQPDNS